MNLPGSKPDSIKRPVGRSHSAPPRRLTLLAASALLLGLAGSALAVDGQSTYAARPAPGPGDRSSGTFHFTVRAGASASDAVEIFNYTGEPAAFAIYGADAVRTTSGGLAPAAREAPITGPGSWIKVDQPEVIVLLCHEDREGVYRLIAERRLRPIQDPAELARLVSPPD